MSMLTKSQIYNIALLDSIKELYNLSDNEIFKILMEVKNDNLKKE